MNIKFIRTIHLCTMYNNFLFLTGLNSFQIYLYIILFLLLWLYVYIYVFYSLFMFI